MSSPDQKIKNKSFARRYVIGLLLALTIVCSLLAIRELFMGQEPEEIRKKTEKALARERYSSTVYKDIDKLREFTEFLIEHERMLPNNQEIRFSNEEIDTLDIEESIRESLMQMVLPLSGSVFKSFVIRPFYEDQAIARIELDLENVKRYYSISHYLYIGEHLDEIGYFDTISDIQKKYDILNDTIFYVILADPDYGL